MTRNLQGADKGNADHKCNTGHKIALLLQMIFFHIVCVKFQVINHGTQGLSALPGLVPPLHGMRMSRAV